MGVSRRSYTEQRGVSESAVRKAIATGRIMTLPDGTIDPAQADSQWGTQTDPAKQRGQHAKQMGADTSAGTARTAATKPVPQAAIRAVADTLLNSTSELAILAGTLTASGTITIAAAAATIGTATTTATFGLALGQRRPASP